MASFTASKRYAKGLLQVGLDTGTVERILSDMKYVQSAVKSTPMLMKVLNSPVVNEAKKKAILRDLLQSHASDVTMKLVDILAEKNRFGLLNQIAVSFQQLYNAHAGILEIAITTAFDLEQSQIEGMVKAMETNTGKTIQYTLKTDKALIGGVAIKHGDTVIDGSVRNKLEQLTELLQVSSV
jgi:F-type H+-transporting ATPase subunit delta